MMDGDLIAEYNATHAGAKAQNEDDLGYLCWCGRRYARQRWIDDNPDLVQQGREVPEYTDYDVARMQDGAMPRKWREACRRVAADRLRRAARLEYDETAGRLVRALREKLKTREKERERLENEFRSVTLEVSRLQGELASAESRWDIEQCGAARRHKNLVGHWPYVGEE